MSSLIKLYNKGNFIKLSFLSLHNISRMANIEKNSTQFIKLLYICIFKSTLINTNLNGLIKSFYSDKMVTK